MIPKTTSAALIVLVLAGFSGCGGDDASPSTTRATSTAAADTGGASPQAVLACLKDAGVDAEDQSSSIGGATIGIDYPGGRTTLSFEESAADADATESAAKAYGEVTRSGTTVVSYAQDPAAEADRSKIESCLGG